MFAGKHRITLNMCYNRHRISLKRYRYMWNCIHILGLWKKQYQNSRELLLNQRPIWKIIKYHKVLFINPAHYRQELVMINQVAIT